MTINFDLHIDSILDNIDELKLLTTSLYKITNRKEKKKMNYIIYHNLSLLYCFVNKDINDYLIKIKNNSKLYKLFENIYEDKKKLFKIQMENEKKLGDNYLFTDISDIFYDNIFYYYGLMFGNDKIKKYSLKK